MPTKRRTKSQIATYYSQAYRMDLIDFANQVSTATYTPLGKRIQVKRFEYQDWGRLTIHFEDHSLEGEHLPVDNLREQVLFLYFLSFEMAVEQMCYRTLGEKNSAMVNQVLRHPRMESCFDLSPYHVLDYLPETHRETLGEFGESSQRNLMKEYVDAAVCFVSNQVAELTKFGFINRSMSKEHVFDNDPFDVGKITADEVRYWLKNKFELLSTEVTGNSNL